MLRKLLQSTNLEGRIFATTTRQTRTSLTMTRTRRVANMMHLSLKMYLDIRRPTKQLSGAWLSAVSLPCIATIERGQSTMLLSGSQSCPSLPFSTFGSPILCKNLWLNSQPKSRFQCSKDKSITRGPIKPTFSEFQMQLKLLTGKLCLCLSTKRASNCRISDRSIWKQCRDTMALRTSKLSRLSRGLKWSRKWLRKKEVCRQPRIRAYI